MAILSLFSVIASYCNSAVWGGEGGAAYTPGNIKSDSAQCALIKKTIKNHYKLAFNTVSMFLFFHSLRHGFLLSWPVLLCWRKMRMHGHGCQNEESTGNTGMFAQHCGCKMKIYWHAILSSFVSRDSVMIDDCNRCNVDTFTMSKCTTECLCTVMNMIIYNIPWYLAESCTLRDPNN